MNLNNLISVERSRIDNLLTNETLDENSELIDIRVGYDGTTYDTAGNAVREQVSGLKGDLDYLNNSQQEQTCKIYKNETDIFNIKNIIMLV